MMEKELLHALGTLKWLEKEVRNCVQCKVARKLRLYIYSVALLLFLQDN